MSIQDELINTIEMIVKKYLDKNMISRDVSSVVTSVSAGKYTVNIDGKEYLVKDGVNISPTVGMSVWVHIPNGKVSNAYICAKK